MVKPPYLPPSTPVHPEAPLILTFDPKTGTTFERPTFVHGWCATAWIIRTGAQSGGSPLASGTAKAPTLMSSPSQASVNAVAGSVTEANQIIYDQCRIALRICAVFELDVRRLLQSSGVGARSVADAFANGKMVTSTDPTRKDFFDIVNNLFSTRGIDPGTAEPEMVGGVKRSGRTIFAEFSERIRRPCVHLFLINDVDRDDRPDTARSKTRGVTSVLELGGSKKGNDARTGTKLRPSQCRRMRAHLQRNIAIACPS